MTYDSRADVVCLLAERYGMNSDVKLGRFRPQLQASYVTSNTEELWYNETVCLWMTIYIYIYCILVASHCSYRLCCRPWSNFLMIFMFRHSSLLFICRDPNGESVPYLPKCFQPCLLSSSEELLFLFFVCEFYLFGKGYGFIIIIIHGCHSVRRLLRLVIKYV